MMHQRGCWVFVRTQDIHWSSEKRWLLCLWHNHIVLWNRVRPVKRAGRSVHCLYCFESENNSLKSPNFWSMNASMKDLVKKGPMFWRWRRAAAAVWASLSDCFEQFPLVFPNLCVFDENRRDEPLVLSFVSSSGGCSWGLVCWIWTLGIDVQRWSPVAVKTICGHCRGGQTCFFYTFVGSRAAESSFSM